MRPFIVGGTFDKQGGATSYIVSELMKELNWPGINGGSLEDLKNVVFCAYTALIWMPNVPNEEEKILPRIKKLATPALLLISSKNATGRDFTEGDFVGRLLQSHSNLGILLNKTSYGGYKFKLMDPLGNLYCDTRDVSILASAILNRVKEITSWTRKRSWCVGYRDDFEIDPEFIEFIKYSAEQFSGFVNAINPNRFLGNASTRCSYGFPAERQGKRIFVTKRNIDKELIDSNGFVEVRTKETQVEYFGTNNKPSVDTPVQIKLFNRYSNINFMVHGHVYVEGAKFTEHKIPCGVVEEYNDIVSLYPDKNIKSFAVNLKGHGCILCADNVENLKGFGNYIGRPFPEE